MKDQQRDPGSVYANDPVPDFAAGHLDISLFDIRKRLFGARFAGYTKKQEKQHRYCTDHISQILRI
jgi:hypothetical protein